MSAYSRVHDLVEIILYSVAEEAKVSIDDLSVEVESVITRGVLEAYGRGKDDGDEHERDTEPPPGTPPKGTPKPKFQRTSMYPTPERMPAGAAGPTAPPPRPRAQTSEKRPRIPTPRPRKYRDPRRDDD